MVKGGRGVASEAQSKPIIPAMGFREVRIIGEKVGKLMLTNSIHFFKEVFMFKLVFATMLFVVVGCASPTAVKSSAVIPVTISVKRFSFAQFYVSKISPVDSTYHSSFSGSTYSDTTLYLGKNDFVEIWAFVIVGDPYTTYTLTVKNDTTLSL